MKIKRLELKKFRRFHHLTIDFGENPTKIVALVGPNGSGKSSVFDAFEERLKYFYGGQHDPTFASKSHYLEGEEKVYNRDEAIVLTTDKDQLSKTSFYIRTPYRFSSSIGVDAIKQLPSTVDEERPASSIQLDSRLQKNYERLIGRFYDEVYDQDKTGKAWVEENLAKINNILEKVLDIRISSLGNITLGRGQLWFQKGESKEFPYMNLSSGEKEVIDLIIDLIIKTKDYTDTVFCIDEPELHLNTAIQRSLLIEIERLIPDTCQLWIATHSIGFLRALQNDLKDKTMVLDFDKDFDENVTLEPIKKTRNNWKKIFKTALEDITGLLSPEIVVYCEGRKDPGSNGLELGFDAEVYNSIFEDEFPSTLFISSGGNTEPEKYSEIALTILGKAFQGVELLLLKDKDINGDGSPTTSDQRKAWLAENSNRRMLERKEIENYLVDFEIFHKAYPNIDRAEYDKIVSDILEQSLKEKIGGLKSLCGVTTGMNKSEYLLGLAGFITKDTEIYKKLKKAIFSKEDS